MNEQPKQGAIAPNDLKPSELDSFKVVQQGIESAKGQADRIPEEIADRSQLGAASDALKALRLARKDAEDAKKLEKAPYTAAGRSLDSAFGELGRTVQGMEESLEARIQTYQRKEREAAEAERKRQERNQREGQRRENAKADAEGRNSRHVPAPPPPPPPPSSARGVFSQTVTREFWKYEITDEAALPDEYVTRTPNRKLIKAHVEAGVSIAGVRAWKEKRTVVR